LKLPFLEKLKENVPTAIVSVWIDSRSCTVMLEVLRKDELIHEEKKHFRSFGNEIPIEAQRLIFGYQEHYRYCHVGTLFKGSNQGALPACKKSEYEQFGVKLEDIIIIPVEDKWSFYAYGSDMVSTKSRYDKSGGIDYIFSPFFLLHNIYNGTFIDNTKLYLLIQKSSITISIYREGMLLYSSFFILETPTELIDHGSEGSEDDENGDNIEDLIDESEEESKETAQKKDKSESLDDEGEESTQNLDELVSLDEEFEDIGELEELDDEEKIEEFQEESEQQVEQQKSEESKHEEDNITNSLDDLNRGMNIINFVKSSMSDFYKNELYASEFIEDVEIADSTEVSSDVLDYIKDELLLNVNIKTIDINSEICKAIKVEIKGA